MAALGDSTAIEPLLAFLRLYRADSAFAREPEALVAAARGVLALAGTEGPARIAEVMKGAAVNAELAQGIAALLAPARASATAPVVASAAPAPVTPAPPTRLSQAAVNATFAEHIDDLRGCILDELARTPELSQVRVAFIAESDGSAHAFQLRAQQRELRRLRLSQGRQLSLSTLPRRARGVPYVVALRTREPAPATDGAWRATLVAVLRGAAAARAAAGRFERAALVALAAAGRASGERRRDAGCAGAGPQRSSRRRGRDAAGTGCGADGSGERGAPAAAAAAKPPAAAGDAKAPAGTGGGGSVVGSRPRRRRREAQDRRG